MTRFEELMDNQAFVDSLDNVTSFDEFKAAFEKEGVDVEEIMSAGESEADAELSEEALEAVAGGVSTKDLKRILKAAVETFKKGPFLGAWKFGTSCGILLRAYSDVQKYGDATRTYSEKQIMNAAKVLGCA